MTRDRRAIAAGYDAGADDYDRRHADRAGAARAEVIDLVLRDACRGARRVLEVGVGTGRLLAQVDAPVRLGVDLAPRMLAHARARGLDVVVGDAVALPIATASVDAAIAGKGALRYAEPAAALAELRRVLVPGGRLAFHLYGGRTWSPRRPAPPHPGLWQPDSTAALRATVTAAGFTVARVARWRSIRVWPYALPIPDAVDARAPVQLWSHVALVARRT